MSHATVSRIAGILRAAAPLAIVTLAIAILLLFPPERYAFYPQCPIYQFLHLKCPGCGTTRALAALLHGHVREAFRLNALTMLLLPLAIVYAVVSYRQYLRAEPLRWPQLPAASIYVVLAISVVFTILRNLPFGSL